MTTEGAPATPVAALNPDAAPVASEPRYDVLLVEDSWLDAQVVEQYLVAAFGDAFTLNVRRTMAEALDFVGRSEPTVVLLDLTLPDSSGAETVAALHTAAPDVPIVVLTSIDDSSVAAAVGYAGASDYVVKRMLNGHVLRKAVRHAVQERALRVERARVWSLRDGFERYRDLARLKAKFINAQAHELRNPLTPMRFQVDLLKHRLGSDDRGVRILDENLRRVVEAIDSMIESSALEVLPETARPGPVPLGGLMREHVNFYAPVLSAMRRQLIVEGTAAADVRTPTLQALYALSATTSAAVELSPERTPIEFSFRYADAMVFVDVAFEPSDPEIFLGNQADGDSGLASGGPGERTDDLGQAVRVLVAIGGRFVTRRLPDGRGAFGVGLPLFFPGVGRARPMDVH